MALDLERHRGRWVAFDETSQGVLVSAPTAKALYAILDNGSFGRVTIQRVPRLDEPVYMGLLSRSSM